MDAARGKKRASESPIVVEEKVLSVAEETLQLRARWELASVFNFLNVFRPLIKGDLGFTAEEIEMALIKPDGVLAAIHIALMKGIPPVSKNMEKPDAWVTVLCKKIHTWWPWVAEGDLPLVASQGAEITKYKEFHSTTRLVMLKALCEIRAEQDDLPIFIDEELRKGTLLSTFRKDKIGGGIDGTSYWCDGGLVIGYRLYKETIRFDSKSRLKGMVCQKNPSLDFSWEIVATNMEEFQKLSDKFLESNNVEEVAVGNFIKDKILPDFEKLQRKKYRSLKKRQREEMLLSNYFIPAYGTNGSRRSCRDRTPVTYTFAEYDRSIDEAIQMEKKHKATQLLKNCSTGKTGGLAEDNATSNGTAIDDDDDDDDDDEDYSDERENNRNDNYYLGESGKEKHNVVHSRPALKQKSSNIIEVGELRRSARHSCNPSVDVMIGRDEMKKKLRQRPNHNVEYKIHVIPDSDEENASENDQATG